MNLKQKWIPVALAASLAVAACNNDNQETAPEKQKPVKEFCHGGTGRFLAGEVKADSKGWGHIKLMNSKVGGIISPKGLAFEVTGPLDNQKAVELAHEFCESGKIGDVEDVLKGDPRAFLHVSDDGTRYAYAKQDRHTKQYVVLETSQHDVESAKAAHRKVQPKVTSEIDVGKMEDYVHDGP